MRTVFISKSKKEEPPFLRVYITVCYLLLSFFLAAQSTSPTCTGQSSTMLHLPSCPDIPWPFGPGVIASANVFLEIIPGPGGNYARFTIVNTSQNLPTCGESAGPDALSFNLVRSITSANITVLAPSTFKEFRTGSTPGCNSPFGQFNYELRRREHDNTNFVFEIKIAGVNLTEADFVTNNSGHRFLSRINGICYNGEEENRAFSSCAPATPVGSIGDFVWQDLNSNGTQDTGEPGIPGATVTLKDNNDNVIATTTTGSNGAYSFTGLAGGTYNLAFTTPAGYIPSPSNAGSDDSKDSDPVNQLVNGVVLAAGENNSTIDAGFIKLIDLSGNVWHDVNAMDDNLVSNSGALQSPPAAGIPVGLRAYLVDASTGLVVKAVLVNSATGTYSFTGVTPNKIYFVYLSNQLGAIGIPPPATTLPEGWEHTGQKLGITSGSDGINDGRLLVPVLSVNVTNANFGIRIKNGEVVIG